jgi:hypothetical protein
VFYKNNRDPFDEWQYRIFKAILFVNFIHTAWQFLDGRIQLSRFLRFLTGLF